MLDFEVVGGNVNLRYLLVNTAHTYQHKIKHRGCHKGRRMKGWCCCTAVVPLLLRSVACTVAAWLISKYRGRVHSHLRLALQHNFDGPDYLCVRTAHTHTSSAAVTRGRA